LSYNTDASETNEFILLLLLLTTTEVSLSQGPRVWNRLSVHPRDDAQQFVLSWQKFVREWTRRWWNV